MLVLVMTSLVLAAAPSERTISVGESRRAAPALAHPRVELRVSSPQLLGRGERRVFPASRIADLELEAVFGGRLLGSHVLELKLFTPRGHLYQVLTVPFSGTRGGRRRKLPGNPRVYE